MSAEITVDCPTIGFAATGGFHMHSADLSDLSVTYAGAQPSAYTAPKKPYMAPEKAPHSTKKAEMAKREADTAVKDV